MFRASVFKYVQDIGLVSPEEKDGVEGAWERQRSMMVHLENTVAEDWVAELDGKIVGWGRSVERGGHLQLTHFFVHPDAQGRGVGRGILERAFPASRGTSRSILATQNPLALSLYLRSGVSVHGNSIELGRHPRSLESDSDIALEATELTDEVREIDRDVVGYEREIDLEFLANDRPLYLVKKGTETAGYAFGLQGMYVGPVGVLDAKDLQPTVALLEAAAARDGAEDFRITIPAPAAETVRWALDNGYRIDPFYEMLLMDSPVISLDRYVMTQPSFIW